MAQSGKDSLWSRFWAAVQAMEHQHTKQADIRSNAIAAVKRKRQDERKRGTLANLR